MWLQCKVWEMSSSEFDEDCTTHLVQSCAGTVYSSCQVICPPLLTAILIFNPCISTSKLGGSSNLRIYVTVATSPSIMVLGTLIERATDCLTWPRTKTKKNLQSSSYTLNGPSSSKALTVHQTCWAAAFMMKERGKILLVIHNNVHLAITSIFVPCSWSSRVVVTHKQFKLHELIKHPNHILCSRLLLAVSIHANAPYCPKSSSRRWQSVQTAS